MSKKIGVRSKYSFLSAAAFASTPIVLYQSMVPLVDLVSATFIIACSFFLIEWVNTKDNGLRVSQIYLCSAGVSLSIALGTKHSNLLTIVGFMLIVLIFSFSRNGSLQMDAERLKGAIDNTVLFGVSALLVSCFWYFRNWMLIGSPVFPFQLKLFGIEIFRGLPAIAANPEKEFDFVNRRKEWLFYPWKDPLFF